MAANFTVKGQVRPLTAAAIIAGTIVLVLALGFSIGQLFFWNAYDKESKENYDLQVALTQVKEAPDSVAGHLSLGSSYINLGNFNQALQQFQAVLKLDPKNQTARYNIALLKIQNKDIKGAQQDLETLKKENPKYWTVRATLGYLYRVTGNYLASVEELQAVNTAEPGRVDVLYQLGLTYQRMGDKAKAESTYREALRYNPSDQTVRQALTAMAGNSNK